MSGHFHCLDGCEKAAGELIDDVLVCADPRCRAPFLPCNPEICPAMDDRQVGSEDRGATLGPLSDKSPVAPS